MKKNKKDSLKCDTKKLNSDSGGSAGHGSGSKKSHKHHEQMSPTKKSAELKKKMNDG
jgi:hypothetical protein